MAGITLAQAEAQLASWLAASTAVASGQSYTIGSRSLTRADARAIQQQIDYWDKKCQELGGTSNVVRTIKVYGGTPV
ncbi:MAG: DUF6148 family protein [Deltaproteobacteria bacterium]|nr:DUF6148 family protein [Deltaproteobacteria bacterium]